MPLFLGDSEPSKIFVGDTPISKVFLGDTQVRPSGGGGWQPGANTLLYQPLESTESDLSGKSGRVFDHTYGPLLYTTVGGVPSLNIGTYGGYKITQPYPFQPDNTKPITFSFWFYITTAQVSYRRLIADRGTTNYNRIWFAIRENTSNIEFAVNYGDTAPIDLIASLPPVNQWNNVIFTCSSTASNMYINGILATSGNGTANPRGMRPYAHDNTQGMFCTRDVNGYSSAFNGNVREVIFEEVERTAQDVTNYYNSSKTIFGV